MALSLQKKKKLVDEVSVIAEESVSVIAFHCVGITVAQMRALREMGYESKVTFKVVKNTLARISLGPTKFSLIKKELYGPIILAFSSEELGASAKIIKKFKKDYNLKFKVIAISLGDSNILKESDLDLVADLPTRDEALSKLMCVMQAPIVKLAQTLNAVNLKLVRTLVAYKDTL